MNLTRWLLAILPLICWSCAAPQQARLTAFNNGGNENNWDKLLISEVDGRRITPPKEAVTVAAGARTVTFSLNYMRGDMQRPILAEVPLIASFKANHEYRADVLYKIGFMGVLIAEQPYPPTGDAITAGALVYSPQFSAYGQKSKQRHKANH